MEDLNDKNPLHAHKGNGQTVENDKNATPETAVENVDYKEFNEKFFDTLPAVLRSVTNTVDSTEDKLMLLLGSLVATSSVLPNYNGIYGNKKLYSNLFFYVLASAGAGKGKLTWVKKLIEPVSHFFTNPKLATEQMSKIDLASVKNLIEGVRGKHLQNLIMPGNISSAAFIKHLDENKGKAFMMETEGDTIANVFSSDYGQYSDMLRKAFEHETISYSRKTDNEKVYIESPQLSLILTSTPKQLFKLISDAENGLFSRFAFMKIKSSPEFKNVFDNTGYDDMVATFEGGGAEVLKMFLQLTTKTEVRFSLSVSQQHEFMKFFSELKATIVNFIGQDLEGSVHRLGSICFRLAMIQSAFRIAESGEFPDTIECSDLDFQNSMLLTELLVSNMVDVYNMLPNSALDELCTNKNGLYRSLPDEFKTALAKQIGANFDMSDRTVDRFLKGNPALFEKVKHGYYRKKIA